MVRLNAYIHVPSTCRYMRYPKQFMVMYPILGRKWKTASQVQILMKSFEANPYPGIKQKRQLAKSLNISQITIENWFGSMRHKKSKQGILKTNSK